MVGRLIVAALIVASAAFVMLSRREAESSDIEVNLSDRRAGDAETRAKALQQQVATLQEQVGGLEAKVQWQGEHLVELTEDCTPEAPELAEVHVASLKRRPAAGDLIGPRELFRSGRVDERFALVLAGDAATVTRLRLDPSLDDGTPLRGASYCDTVDSDDPIVLLGAFQGEKPVSGDFGRQRIEKKRGVLALELRCDLALPAQLPITVEVLTAGGGVAQATLAPLQKAEAPAARPR